LAELKGRAATIPNQGILINTLTLQEAKASSEIENIVTTQDELFHADLHLEGPGSAAAKEVALYRDALKLGYDRLQKSDGLITNRTLIEIFRLLKGREDGFRVTPGTTLKNDITGEVVYVPPQDAREIEATMAALERFINEDELSALDPLIKMALIHHQFESIHPFYDGNGRTGRIINVLYLVKERLLDIPVLYLSQYIVRNKARYYELLQAVRDQDAWEDWVLFMLDGVEITAKEAIDTISQIRAALLDYKHRIRSSFRFYSQDLINTLFTHPYTKIEYTQRDLKVVRLTAARYLDQLAEAGFATKVKMGRSYFYINDALCRILLAQE